MVTIDIPRVKKYPPGAGQCDDCGGFGIREDGECRTCEGNGWVPHAHLRSRRCALRSCRNPLKPESVAVYCSDDCAYRDA